jgi:hypothetical protein
VVRFVIEAFVDHSPKGKSVRWAEVTMSAQPKREWARSIGKGVGWCRGATGAAGEGGHEAGLELVVGALDLGVGVVLLQRGDEAHEPRLVVAEAVFGWDLSAKGGAAAKLNWGGCKCNGRVWDGQRTPPTSSDTIGMMSVKNLLMSFAPEEKSIIATSKYRCPFSLKNHASCIHSRWAESKRDAFSGILSRATTSFAASEKQKEPSRSIWWQINQLMNVL